MEEMEKPLSNKESSSADPYENFGKRVRVSREVLGKGQLWLSERLRVRGVPVSKTALSKLESGERAVKLAEAVALCDILDLDLNLRELGSDPDELAVLTEAAELRVSEAEEAVRFAQAEHRRAEARRGARALLRDAARLPSNNYTWKSSSGDLLRVAFGSDQGAAMVALRALGVPDSQLKGRAGGHVKNRTHFYSEVRLRDWLPNLNCEGD